MSICAEPMPLPNALFFLKMCGEGGRFASPLNLPATDNDCCVESSAKAAGPEIVVPSAASLSYFLSQHLDEWRNEHISSNYDQVFSRWRYSCSLLYFPFVPKHQKCHTESGGPGDSWRHQAGFWRVAGCDAPTLWGRSLQRPWDGQAGRGHHHHLRFGVPRRQLTLRRGGRFPCPRLFSRPGHRRGHALWLRWALDPREPKPWW